MKRSNYELRMTNDEFDIQKEKLNKYPTPFVDKIKAE